MREKMLNNEIGLNLYDAAYIVSYGNIPVKRVCESDSGRFLQVFDDTPTLHKLLIEKACNQQLERYISAMNQLRGIFLSHMREKRCSILSDSQMLYGNKEREGNDYE